MRSELKLISANIDMDTLTLEASRMAAIIDNTILDLNTAANALSNGELTVETARKYLKNIATEQDILDFESELTIESSYGANQPYGSSGAGRPEAKFVDIVNKVYLMIVEAIKKFINVFKQFITKVRIATSDFVKITNELNTILDNKLDISGNIDIDDLGLKQQVYDLIGAYALQHDDLTLEAGIVTALTSPKDYDNLSLILNGLGKWNTSLLNENAFNVDDFKDDKDWSKRHAVLLESWKTNIVTKRLPSSLTKLSTNITGNLFGSDKHLKLLEWGKLNYFEKRLGYDNLAFLTYGVDGKVVHLVTAYNQTVGRLMTATAEVSYDVKNMVVQYPTIALMKKCIKDIAKHDYSNMEKEIMSVVNTIEKDFKAEIDQFMKARLNNDKIADLPISVTLRTTYSGNIGTINNIAMSMVAHTFRNNHNLIKYVNLMASKLENK